MSATSASKASFLGANAYNTDKCAKEARDVQNTNIANYGTWQYLPVPCDQPAAMRSPAMQYDHVNLRTGIGYGLSDSCTIDTYSSLRNDPTQMTRDKCRTQLFTRIFFNVPCMKAGIYDSDKESPLIEGMDTSQLEGVTMPCKKTLSEVNYDRFMPLVPCLKDNVQNVKNVVESWKRGGEDTRETMRQSQFLESCGVKRDERNEHNKRNEHNEHMQHIRR